MSKIEVSTMQTARVMNSDQINLARYTFKEITMYKRQIYISCFNIFDKYLKKHGYLRLCLPIKSVAISFVSDPIDFVVTMFH